MTEPNRVWASLIRSGQGCFLIALITFVCDRLHLNLTITGFIYLIAIVLQSLIGNFISSALVSVVAVLCLDFFFTPPRFSLEVTSPLDILALISFDNNGAGRLAPLRLNCFEIVLIFSRSACSMRPRQKHTVRAQFPVASRIRPERPAPQAKTARMHRRRA
jgi:hypothetical protein